MIFFAFNQIGSRGKRFYREHKRSDHNGNRKACLEKKKTKCYTMKCTGKRVEKAGDYQRVDGH